ncbi:MAG TPA: TolC family protein [Candidatus Kapabacteria bacterium]|jgi:outer membrane protein TolC|nr:TolC family protein [Candidatus Kapabacteria bacterium]HOV92343.1 TolC family protein [Candidatus Kapabacteria bacterium]
MSKKKFKFILLFISVLLFSNFINLYTQDTTKLSDLINLALENNYQIHIIKNEQLKSQNNNTIGNAGFLPTLDATFSQDYDKVNSEQQLYSGDTRSNPNANNNSTNAAINLSWTVFDGFQMFAQKSKFQDLEQLGAINTRYYMEQTVSDLAKAYYQLVNEINKLNSFNLSKSISYDRYQLEQKKMELGTSNLFQLQLAQLDYLNDSSAVIEQTNLITQLQVQLNQIINRNIESQIIPENSIQLNELANYNDLKDSAFKYNANLNLSQIQEIINTHNIRIQESQFYPEISFIGGYSFLNQNNSSGLLKTNKTNGFNYGLSVRFNLFNGTKDRIQLQNLKIDQQNDHLQTKQMQQTIEAGLYNNYITYRSVFQQYQLQEEKIKIAQNNMNLAQRQYELGQINGFDFRQTQLNYIQAQTQLLDLRYVLKTLEINILQISGTLMNNVL